MFKNIEFYTIMKNLNNVLLCNDIFCTTLSYHKFILKLFVKDYIRIAKKNMNKRRSYKYDYNQSWSHSSARFIIFLI
jgi:hypothetical protein